MKYPDLLVAFDVDPAAYRETNGYVIAEKGKPPDLALEIGSPDGPHRRRGEARVLSGAGDSGVLAV